MDEKRYFAVGDIHGEAGKLRKLLRLLKFQAGMCEDDVLVQLGDIVDRGPDVKRCVEILLEHNEMMECIFLRGNHENLMLDAIMNPDKNQYLWDVNGGSATRRSYHRAPTIHRDIQQWMLEVPTEHREFFYDQTYFHETDDYFFSHAPLPKIQFLKKDYESSEEFYKVVKDTKDRNLLTWTWHGHTAADEDHFALEIPGNRYHVVGHVHRLMENIKVARLYPHIAYMDAGCGCGRDTNLAALELPSKTIYYSDGTTRPFDGYFHF